MNWKLLHSVWTLVWHPRKPSLGVQTLCMSLLLCLASPIALADCPSAPIGDPDDMAISFLKANGVQAASASLLASSVKEGMLVYDDSDDTLKLCDGTNWLPVGSNSGTDTLASLACAAGEIPKFNGSAWACAADGGGSATTYVSAYHTATQQTLTSTASKLINWNEESDAGNNFSTGTFTAPNAGYYAVYGGIGSENHAANEYIEAQIRKNGGSVSLSRDSSTAAWNDPYSNVTWYGYLAAGDTIELWGRTYSTSAPTYATKLQVVSIGGGADTLAGLSCAAGDIPKWSGSTWACATDGGGSGGSGGSSLEFFAGSSLLVGNIAYHNVTPTNDYPVTVPAGTKAVKLNVHYNHNSGTTGTHGYLGFLAYQKGQTAANKKVSYFSQHFNDYANSDIAYLDIPWDDSLDDQVTIQVTSSYNTDPLNIYNIYFGGYVVGGGGSDTLAGLSCSSGQIPKWNGTAWSCAADGGGSGSGDLGKDGFAIITASVTANTLPSSGSYVSGYGPVTNCPAGSTILTTATSSTKHDWTNYGYNRCAIDGNGIKAYFLGTSNPNYGTECTGICVKDDFGGGSGADTLAGLSCTNGQIAKWNGAAWVCAADDGSGVDVLNNTWLSSGSFSQATGATIVPAGGSYNLGSMAVEKGVYLWLLYNCDGQVSYTSTYPGNHIDIVGPTVITSSFTWAELDKVPDNSCGVFYTGVFKSSGPGNVAVRIRSYDNSILVKNGVTSFEARVIKISGGDGSGGGGGGASTLVALSDVNISSPADGHILKYDNASGKWINGAAGGSATPGGTVAGSVQFRGSTAVLAADDVNLIWDNTNKRLGIGTATPAYRLQVAGGPIQRTTTDFNNSDTGSNIYLNLAAESGNTYGILGSATTGGTVAGKLAIMPYGGETVVGATGAAKNTRMTIRGAGANNYNALALTSNVSNSTTKGGMIGGMRFNTANDPFVGFGVWDDGVNRAAYVGGGSWSAPDATMVRFFTAPAYDETAGTSVHERMRITSAGNIGIGTLTPAASALLDMTSTARGFLPPRMNEAERDAISSPATGLMIFNTTAGQYQFWTGTAWSGLGGSGVPTGTIAAFAATTCPAGWTEYTAARGRFLRGIDNGAGNDPDGTRAAGNTQADDLKSHTHPGGPWVTGSHGPSGTGVYMNGTYGVRTGVGAAGGSETRPKNVAVLFCQYSGSGGSGGASTLVALSDVNISSPSDGQVLKYDNASGKWINGAASGTVTPAGSNGSIQFRSGTSLTADPVNLHWDDTNNRLGIGVNTPEVPLHIAQTGDPATSTMLFIDTYGATSPSINPAVVGRTSVGTPGSPSATKTGNKLLFLGGRGDDGTGFTSGSKASITFSADEDWSSTAQGTRIMFGVTPTGATTGVEAMRIAANGNLGIGTVAPQSKLHVAGGIQLADDAAACPGSSNVKVGTLKYASNTLSVCNTAGWIALSTGSGATATANVGYVQIAGASGAFADSGTTAGQQLFWDNTNKRLGIGTTAPSYLLDVVGNGTNGFLRTTGTVMAKAVGSYGSVNLLSGSSTLPGYIEWRMPSADGALGARRGYLGWNAANVALTLENSSAFLISGGKVGVETGNPTGALEVSYDGTYSASGGAIVASNKTTPAKQIRIGYDNAVNAGYIQSVESAVGYKPLLLNPNGGNVGIGTTTPKRGLHVSGGSGFGTIQVGTAGTGDSIASLDLVSLAGGTNALGEASAKGWQILSRSAAYAATDQQNDLMTYYWNGTAWRNDLTIDSLTGNVGVGTASPQSKLHLVGLASGSTAGGFRIEDNAGHYRILYMTSNNSTLGFHGSGGNIAYLTDAGVWTNASDVSIKKDIKPISYGLETVMKLNPVHYKMKSSDIPQIGFIAQEVRPLMPELVDGIDGSMTLSYGNMTAVLAKALQELKADNDNLRDGLNAANDNYEELRREIDALKAAR